MKSTPYDIYWNNRKNWKWHLIYACKEDLRIIVPKRPTWAGRTLNFAHPKSFLVLFLTVLAIAAPAMFLGHINNIILASVFTLVIIGIIIFYYRVQLYAK
ncbi:MAG: hypothetical protein WCS65_16340 [Verrucomicrobiae bacterium]